MKIRTRILGGFMVVTFIALLLGGVGMLSTFTLDGITIEVAGLQDESADISKILNAHFVWRQGLTEAVMCGENFTGSLDANACALGTWLSSEQAGNVSNPEVLKMLNDVKTPHDFIHSNAKTIVAFIEAGDMEAAEDCLENVILPKTTEVISILTNIQTKYSELVDEKTAESVQVAATMKIINIALALAAVIGCAAFAQRISGVISKPITVLTNFMKKAGATGDLSLTHVEQEQIEKFSLRKDEVADLSNGAAAFVMRVAEASKMMKTVADGDLTIDVDLLSDADEIGITLREMTKNLSDMVGEIRSSTDQVTTGARQVAEGSQHLAEGATEQTAAIEELSGAIAEIAQKTRDNANTANQTAMLSESIKGKAEKGNRQMDEMISAVRDINDASQSIGKIIKTIDDIAFQTNILALNAAVEAARAGHHGKGFAVVAEEVRNLASKCAEAAKDTGDMIQNSIEKAELGSHIAMETAESLREIVSGINEAGQFVSEIAAASEVQTHGIEKINTEIDHVAQIVQQNSATAQESAAASEQMSSQSDTLHKLVSQFTLKGDKVINALPTVTGVKTKHIAIPGMTGLVRVSSDF